MIGRVANRLGNARIRKPPVKIKRKPIRLIFEASLYNLSSLWSFEEL
jgi:hypothetical protein